MLFSFLTCFAPRSIGNPVGGRIVYVNAELHTLVKDASPDYTYSDSGNEAYCRHALLSNLLMSMLQDY